MASVEHAPVEERHRDRAKRVVCQTLAAVGIREVPFPNPPELEFTLNYIAQMFADWEQAGEERGWADAKKAVRAMQPNHPRTETAFECFSANSQRIGDVLREMDYYRRPESRPR